MALETFVIAIRVLRKNPLFTLTAVATLALGLAATTHDFQRHQWRAVQPLPYKDPARIVIAGMDLRQRHVRDLPFSNAAYRSAGGYETVFEDCRRFYFS